MSKFEWLKWLLRKIAKFVLLVIMLIVTFVIVWLFLAVAFLAAIAGVG